ncbi:RluA family pseudouridine synthase [Domibacillus sp. DTU_2020_1001157_1_SI_ALB_TIR_016]|uniref:RluA family pseudouridine synthase n=1 Tax=Domibacillus sp. DTU_2020_1001157_1_SI_ALB_TIR_016 TaxID=3077789 RepID=UPI0028EB8386|nr:RluA family pseudouridine synthase [Domibacillus sp. DTU_2020_1001157_1_SI_ALB_TIR_016]WNS80039.1 RluA family pseudouridine synthase [Domibacillus sp. DTU_2020_1001157_1_SI_ALB_TIR_016]
MIPLSAVNGKPFELCWTADEDGLLLRTFLAQKAISKRALTDIKFTGGLIEVNGREVNVRHVLSAGDAVRVVFPPEVPSGGLEAEPVDLPVLFEDKALIAVAKPAGMNTIPSREHPSGSLASGLLWLYREQGLQATAHIVTRLDRDTSGIVLAAKNRYVHHLMSEMQKQKKVFRQYEALAEGIFEQASGFVEAPIGRRDDSIIERMVREDGQYARTVYKVIRQYDDFAHVAVKPETGRTHQIRVHLAHVGHPLAGDDLYGGSRSRINRQALHCGSLSFHHPVTGAPIDLTMPMPMDMKNMVI